jgi:hypothetical protein
MHTSLLVLHVQSKGDVLLARQRSRQVARLLGYDFQDQACIAAAVFEIACQARTHTHRTELHFQVEGTSFHVFAKPVSLENHLANHCRLQLEKPLPSQQRAVSFEDIAWVLRQLGADTRVNLFIEIRRQNQELLRTMAELQTRRVNRAPAPREGAKPAA